MKLPQGQVDVQGHRGARGLFPENTVEGFVATIALGVTALELDVCMTADNVVVVSHDAALHPDLVRTADGAWLPGPGPLIRSLRYDEILNFDVGRLRPGSRYAQTFPDQRPMDGARIPRLHDVLAATGKAGLTIEMKTFPDHPDWSADPVELANATLAVVDAADATSRVMLESFDWRGLHHVQTIRPDMPLGWLTRASLGAATRLWWNGIEPLEYGGSVPRALLARGAKTWLPEHCDLTVEQIQQAHELGIRVVTWTVNEPADMARLMQWGVDGIISDRPDLLLALLA